MGWPTPCRQRRLLKEKDMRVEFSAEVEVPDGTPTKDVEAWLAFHLGTNGGLPCANPLSDTDLVSVGCTRLNVRTPRQCFMSQALNEGDGSYRP